MILRRTFSEIEQYSAQLAEFLAAKFVDHALIQGFVTVLQEKFRTWIIADLKLFRSLFDADSPGQIDTSAVVLIDLLQLLWAKFHHPIIKLYQRQHAELFAILVNSLKTENEQSNSKKQSDKKRSPRFRVVEMRKLNEAFQKLVSVASSFYCGIILHLTELYPNPLIPQGFLSELDLAKVWPNASKNSNNQQSLDGAPPSNLSDFHSTLSYTVFYCLLNMGNLLRHSAQIQLSYVQPGKSIAAYYKHLKGDGIDIGLANKLYFLPLLHYSKCIGILPTMHEPYNHIGVIHNAMGEKFTAAVWFLRSQTTRDTATTVGKYNLHAVFSKPWLEELYKETLQKQRGSLTPSDVNTILMRIVADYFFPKAYEKPLYVCKVEADFLDIIFTRQKNIALIPSLVTDHITVLICFLAMAQEDQNTSVFNKFLPFSLKFFEKYLVFITQTPREQLELELTLRNIRLMFAFLRRNQSILRTNPSFLSALADVLNVIVDFDDDAERSNALEYFVNDKAPIRSHYFAEDVKFKDFTPIGCQFKDFNDEHLFASNNVDLLFGSYFYSDDIPSFLDNKAIQRINKDIELGNGSEEGRKEAIAQECTRYENLMRIRAIVVMAKKLIGPRISAKDDKFVIEKIEAPITQSKASRKNKKKLKKKQDAKLSQESIEPERLPSQISEEEGPTPTSFKEIEQMILGHAAKILNKEAVKDLGSDLSLLDMVDSIVSEENEKTTQNDESQVFEQTNEPGHTTQDLKYVSNSGTNGQPKPIGTPATIDSMGSMQILQPLHILHPPGCETRPAPPYEKTGVETFLQDLHLQAYGPNWTENEPGQLGPYAHMQMPMQVPMHLQMPMQVPMGYFPPSFPLASGPPLATPIGCLPAEHSGSMAFAMPLASIGHIHSPVNQPYSYPLMVPGTYLTPVNPNYGGNGGSQSSTKMSDSRSNGAHIGANGSPYVQYLK